MKLHPLRMVGGRARAAVMWGSRHGADPEAHYLALD